MHDRDHRSHDARRPEPSGVAVPGKQTLAQHGIAGPSQALPHREAIQRSFGPDHDLSAVRAHVGGAAGDACAALGAEGYATGLDIAFRRAPDLALAAHEAAHIIQQRDGVSFSGVGSPNDAYERAADQVAARVVAGQSAADLLPRGGGAASQAAVQCFHTIEPGKQTDQAWGVGGVHPLRVSDDGRLAVLEERTAGSHMLWADRALLKPAARALIDAGSPITLLPGSDTIQGVVPGTGAPITLTRIEVEHDDLGTKDDAIEMPDDCGRCAHEVSGAKDQSLVARTHGKTGEQLTTATNPPEMKHEILLPELRSKRFGLAWIAKRWKNEPELINESELKECQQRVEMIRRHEREVIQACQERLHRGEPQATVNKWRQKEIDKLTESLKRAIKKIDDLVVAAYQQLTPEKRAEIEQRLGINEFADPEIAEAFTVVTGGDKHPEGAFSYNFHWAAVIMKSGGDAVTMENSAEQNTARNTNWIFKMYGVPTEGGAVPPKPEQSFHEQQRDISRAHGKYPTTLVAHHGPLPVSGPSASSASVNHNHNASSSNDSKPEDNS